MICKLLRFQSQLETQTHTQREMQGQTQTQTQTQPETHTETQNQTQTQTQTQTKSELTKAHPDNADLRWQRVASTGAEVKGAMSRWATGKATRLSTFLVVPLSVALKRFMCKHSTGGSCRMDICLVALRWHWHLPPRQGTQMSLSCLCGGVLRRRMGMG